MTHYSHKRMVYATDAALIGAIAKGGKEREEALKQLVLEEELNLAVSDKLCKMGGVEDDVPILIDEALIDLVRGIRKNRFSTEKTVRAFILEQIVRHWLARLSVEAIQRKKVMDYIANDGDLKNRILARMHQMGCQSEEAEEVYNQGFIKLNEVLIDKKYRGGDIKGLFYRICEFLRLNDRRKSKELLPDILPEKGAADVDDIVERHEKQALLKKWLNRIGEKCRKTLKMWNDGFSMKEIAEAIPYRDHKEAAVAKHRCLKKLFNLIDVTELS